MYNFGYKLIFIYYFNLVFFDIVVVVEIDYYFFEKYFKYFFKFYFCCIIYVNKIVILSGVFGVRMGELCYDYLKIYYLMEMVKMIKL